MVPGPNPADVEASADDIHSTVIGCSSLYWVKMKHYRLASPNHRTQFVVVGAAARTSILHDAGAVVAPLCSIGLTLR